MGGSGGNNAVPPPLPKKMNKVIITHVHLSMQMGALQKVLEMKSMKTTPLMNNE